MKKVADIDKCIQDMTLEEKAMLVNGANFFGSHEISRLGIDRIQFLDGGTGINYEQLFGDMTEINDWSNLFEGKDKLVGSKLLSNVIEGYFDDDLSEEEEKLRKWIKEILFERLQGDYTPGCFPPGILLGSTWNKDLIYQVGRALGMEAVLYDIDVLLGTPNVNIHRDPLNGRLFEGYSEDPVLVSKLAPELCKGVQSYGICANVKHFAANNQETNRMGINEIISRRALEEIYLPGFKACVTEGQVKSVMSAYNKINGVPCTENIDLLETHLREKWGFDGFVVSDWTAVSDGVKAVFAGNDLAMPGPRDYKIISEAVRRGELSEECLDKSVKRILKIINWISDNKNSDVDKEYAREFTTKVAYESACEGIVLLENSILPLQPGKKVLCLAGTGTKKLLACGEGSAGIKTDRIVDFRKCILEYTGVENITDDYNASEVVVLVSTVTGMEGNDRKDLKLPKVDIDFINSCDKDIVLVLNTSGPVDLFSIRRDNIKAVLAAYLPGMEGGRALADIIFGKVNPSGKLSITFPKRYEDTPTYLNFPGDGDNVAYGEGIYVGYRYYDKKKIEPMYPFGYGMSYTSFEASIERVEVNENDINISVLVKNTGAFDGKHVVQIYVSDVYSTLSKPIKELKAFEKVFVEAGKEIIVNLSIALESLGSFDADIDAFVVEEGFYDIILSDSADYKDEQGRERIYLDIKSPYSYGINSRTKTICENTQTKEILYSLWNKYNLDVGILESSYKYESGKKIHFMLDGAINDKDIKDRFISEFEKELSRVKKM